MLDSGAFSAWTKKINIDLDEYIDFCLQHLDYIDYVINLDVIPGEFGQKALPVEEIERSASEGWANYEYMTKQGIPKEKLIHIFHQGEDFKWLEKIVDAMPYIGLSPANDRSTSEKMQWLDDCMKYVCDDKGYPKVKWHGFAVTSLRLMFRYPWYSVDSVAGDSLLLVKEAGRIRVDTIEDLYYSSLGKKQQMSSGHITKELANIKIFIPDENGIGNWTQATKVIRHDTMKKRYQVKTRRGRKIELTGDHGVFVKNKKQNVLKCLKTTELKEKEDFVVGVDYKEPFGDRKEIVLEIKRKFYNRGKGKQTATTKKLPLKVSLDNLFLELVGLWVADGSYSSQGDNTSVQLSVGNDKECKQVVRNIGKRYNASTSISTNKIDINIHSALLSRIIKSLGIGRGSTNKEIPWWVFELPEKQLCSFLRGYFSGDGTAGDSIECSTVSRKLFYGLFCLLTKLKINPLFFGLYDPPGIDGFTGKIRKNNDLFLVIGDLKSLILFRDKIGFLQKRKNKKVEATILSKSEARGIRDEQKGNEIYLKCNTIKELGIVAGPVYDLEVPGAQRFVANGLLVHNSTSWVMTSRMGRVYVPRYKSGKWIYDENSWKISVSARSPDKSEAGKHIDTFPKQQKNHILDYFAKKGYLLGKSEFQFVSKNHKLKDNEKWNGPAMGNKREIEIAVESGLCNDYKLRDELNIIYYLDLEKSMPEWPWPFKPKGVKGFDL